jgi:hypothetical protein
MKYSAQEKHRELLREIEMRKSVYPRRVMSGSMSQRQADRQIAILQEIAEDYRTLADRERLL